MPFLQLDGLRAHVIRRFDGGLLGFFVGIESLDMESSLAAASASLAVLGMRMLDA